MSIQKTKGKRGKKLLYPRCIECGETDINNFYTSKKYLCKKCNILRSKNNIIKRSKEVKQRQKNTYEKIKNDPILWAEYTKYQINYYNNNLFRLKILNAKNRAKRKNMNFDLTEEFLQKLYQMQNGKCYYSHIELDLQRGNSDHSISIDRKDSSKGYTLDNVVLCSWAVNIMKSNLNDEEFKFIISAIYNKLMCN